MTDGRALARTYLEQQRLLGGDSVILPDGPTPGASAANPQARADRATSELPPPGLSFDPPSGDLFTSDPLQQAGSLDAIAALVRACKIGRAHV